MIHEPDDFCACMLHFEKDSDEGKLKLVIEIQDKFHVSSISEAPPIELTIKRDKKDDGHTNEIRCSKIYSKFYTLEKKDDHDVKVTHDYKHPHPVQGLHDAVHRPIDPRK